MKVVLFCGGLGTRLREYSEIVPKPLVNVGPRPIIWNLMKYYAHHGHKDFILCLGYKGEMIKEYFLNYNEWMSNDFVMKDGGKNIELHNSDINDWTITFVDTGLKSNVGQRLLIIKEHLKGEDIFLANYTDGLSDLPLQEQIDLLDKKNAVANFVSVRPSQSFHSIKAEPSGHVTDIQAVGGSDFWINGGFFALRSEIFDYINEGEDLIEEPFNRLIEMKKLVANKYNGFWAAMDTFKDKKTFDAMYENGNTPWKVWEK